LEEQKAAEERRKEEAKVAKEKLKKAKEAEQKEAASRRSAKTAAKRAAAKEKAEAAALQAAKRLKSKQETRSTLFTLLLSGPTVGATEDLLSTVQAAVKKDDVAVHGWEQLDSSLDMSDLGREPRKETLLHLAVKAGLLELANWLCDNGKFCRCRFSYKSVG
jgi:signal recognition particle GTPase